MLYIKDKNQKGLTLVELLLIMAILGIIAVIAFPIIWNVIDDARSNAIAAEAVHIISAAKILQATEVTNESSQWNEEELAEYMSTTVASFDYVQYVNGEYAIVGHEVYQFLDVDINTPITDQMLASFLSGN